MTARDRSLANDPAAVRAAGFPVRGEDDDPEPTPPSPRAARPERYVLRVDEPHRFGGHWGNGPLGPSATEAMRKRVIGRIERATDLTIRSLEPRRYHVTGGEDPDGHYVDLTGERGTELCDCPDHAWHEGRICKHVIAGLRELGWRGDQIRQLALYIEIRNAAFAAAFAPAQDERRAA